MRKEHSSEAYREFLQFLELGCAGSPVDGYPTVLVVLSTIPSSVCSLLLHVVISNPSSRSSRLPLGRGCPSTISSLHSGQRSTAVL